MHRYRSAGKRRRLPRARAGLALVALVGGLVVSALPASAGAESAGPGHDRHVVRLTTGPAAQTGRFLDKLLADFEEQTRYRVVVTVARGTDQFDRARAGQADVVLTHWGFVELENFVSEGLGMWPTTVFANTVVFISPPNDPAGIRGVADPVEAFRRIAQTESPFIVNDLGEVRYLTDTLWNAADRPDKEGWFLDPGLRGPAAVRAAEQRNGYTIWGLHPFRQQSFDMDAVVYNDSLMQRIMATVVVKPGHSRRVNVGGALALERFLADPATQGRIRAFSLPDIDGPVFWPAGNQNDNR